ncbi:S8 family serine peptidase [Fictibacillus gelatini]|uniref:S8 family serine peptidase n=1 Tax=Fictibacillus gelatini TaxID=225985 RepID=UPI000685D48C|nr:S8 family serine peptidase [Fictibacillus gelatini]
MNYIKSIFLFFLFSFVSVSVAHANEITVKPKVSKYSTKAMFDKKKEFASGQLIIKFKQGTTHDEKERLFQTLHLKEISSLTLGDFSLVSVPKEMSAKLAATRLVQSSAIEFAEPNYHVKRAYIPKDSGYKKQWFLKKINAAKAWNETKGASNVTVAVVDGGVQKTHPEFKGRIVKPYNAVTGKTSYPFDKHATHVAGIIAASMNNKGTVGLAPKVNIMPVNVFVGNEADFYDIARGIEYAADHGADIINLSLGSYDYSYVIDYAVNYAYSKGVIVIAAAGNEDTYKKSYPAALDHVLGVSATNDADRITWFSNYGSYIDLAAPGEDIYSTVTGNSYEEMSGTSMAAPVVSGTAALILSKDPFLTPSQVEGILKKSTVDLGPKGRDDYYGNGRVDAYKAVTNTPSPLFGLSSSVKSFPIKGTNTASISFHAVAKTKVSVYVKDSKGNVIRNIISKKPSSGGKKTVTWDGKTNDGDYAPNGTYEIWAKVTNGKKSVYKNIKLKVVDQVLPAIKPTVASAYVSPNKVKTASVPFVLSRKGKLTATINDQNGKVVKTIWKDRVFMEGKHSLSWDFKTASGNKASDGEYTIKFSLVDALKRKGCATVKVKVDSKAPKAKLPLDSSLFKADGNQLFLAKATINENSVVNAYVVSEQGEKEKKLISNQSYQPGAVFLNWDGTTEKGTFAAEGTYRLELDIKDQAGNETSVKSGPFTFEDWRTPVIEGAPSVDYTPQGNTETAYTLLKAGKVTIEIRDEATVIRTIETDMDQSEGKHSFTWDGKDQSGNAVGNGVYRYTIKTVDSHNLDYTFTGEINVHTNE